MERVAFLIEPGQQRIGCLLNPEGLVTRRLAGVRERRSASGVLTGAGLGDDPLLFTGGGRTELELDVLFDVALAGSSIRAEDVRELTAPLWALAENDHGHAGAGGAGGTGGAGYGRVPFVRFIWGKAWNLPGVVVAVAERLERFTASGAPQRSWLRLRLVRVGEPDVADVGRTWAVGTGGVGFADVAGAHEVLGGAPAAESIEAPPSALVTASDLLALALERSGVPALVADAAASVRAHGEAALAEIAGWGARAGAKAVTTLSDAMREVVRRTTAWTQEPAERLVRSLVNAGGVVGDALGRARRALSEVAGDVGAAAATSVREAFAAVEAAVAPMAAAAARVVRDVRATAARSLGEAGVAVQAVVDEVAFVLEPVVAATSIVGAAASRAALEAGREALGEMAEVWRSWRSTGHEALDAVPPVLTTIAGAVERLRDLGERRAAAALARGAEVLAVQAHRAHEAQQALAAVSSREAAEVIGERARALREAVVARGAARPAVEGETERAPATAPGADADAAASADAADDAGAPAPTASVPEALADLRAATLAFGPARLPAIEVSEAEVDGDTLERLDELLRAVDAAVAAEEADTSDLLRQAVAGEEAKARRTFTETSGRDAVRPGERLEHVAYRHYGDPAAWRWLASVNGIDDPTRLPTGRVLSIVAR